MRIVCTPSMYIGPRCDVCDRPADVINEDDDTIMCNSCLDNAAEAAWERYNEYLMETGGGPSLRDQQIAAQKFK